MASRLKILVTGASGFIGRCLLPILRKAYPDARLIAASRAAASQRSEPEKTISSNLMIPDADEIVSFNLLHQASMTALLQEVQPDIVVHLAAQAVVKDSFRDPDHSWRVNLDGTLALAGILLRDLPATFLVFISSAEIYGL